MFQLGSWKVAYSNRKRASVNFVNFPSREILRDSSGRKDITRALALEILKDPAPSPSTFTTPISRTARFGASSPSKRHLSPALAFR